MDGFADLLDCITDDRGLFFLSVSNEAVVPGWIYASYWRRHGVVLRTRISTLGSARTDTVCIPQPRIFRIVIEYQFVSSFADRSEAIFRPVKNRYNK
jgi:hypothetical protein